MLGRESCLVSFCYVVCFLASACEILDLSLLQAFSFTVAASARHCVQGFVVAYSRLYLTRYLCQLAAPGNEFIETLI